LAEWYALHVRANHERVTATYLQGRGVEHFLPLYRTKSRRRDRPGGLLERPLFSGYLFVRVDLRSPERIAVLQSPGAVKLVGFGSGPPSMIPDEIVRSLRILVQDGTSVRPHPYLETGRRARIVDGPFTDAVGFLDRRGRQKRLVVTLDLLGRSVSVPVTDEGVELIF